MAADSDQPLAGRVTAAADRTVAAGTARLFSAWCEGSPVPQAGDERVEGVVDFAQRRADVFGSPIPERLTMSAEGMGDKIAEFADTNPDLYLTMRIGIEKHRTIHDGAREFSRVDDRWIT